MRRGSKFKVGDKARVTQGPGEGTIVLIVAKITDSHWATDLVRKFEAGSESYWMDEDWMDLYDRSRSI